MKKILLLSVISLIAFTLFASEDKFEAIDLPSWVLFSPSGINHSIAIASSQAHIDFLEETKQRAAVEIARNRFCYAVRKRATLNESMEELESEKRADFELVVANPKDLSTIYKSLVLTHKYIFGDYFIARYSTDSTTQIVDNHLEVLDSMPPLPLYLQQDTIKAYHQKEGTGLQKTFEQSIEGVRLQIAEYKSKNLATMTKKFNQNQKGKTGKSFNQNVMTDESSAVLKNISISRLSILTEKSKFDKVFRVIVEASQIHKNLKEKQKQKEKK